MNNPLIRGPAATLSHTPAAATHKRTKKSRSQGDTYHCLQSAGFCAGANISHRGVMRLVNRGFGYSWTPPAPPPPPSLHSLSTPVPGVRRAWHFKLYHLSQERHWLLRSAALPAATNPCASWPVVTGNLSGALVPAGGCGRRPAVLRIVSWLLIDLRAAESS